MMTSMRYPGLPNSRSGSTTKSNWHHACHSLASARNAVVLPVPGAPCTSSIRPVNESPSKATSWSKAVAAEAV